jgi:hypothetical protein
MTQTYLSAMDDHHAEWIPEHGTPAYIRDHGIVARLSKIGTMPEFLNALSPEEVDRIRMLAESRVGRTLSEGPYPKMRRTAFHKDAPTARVKALRWHWEGGTCCTVRGPMKWQKPGLTLDGADFMERIEAGDVVCKTCLGKFNNA